MSVFTYGPKPIVDNGLVLHIDPANPVSAGSTQREDPINGVTDMSKEGRKYYSTSSVDSTGGGNTSYKPAWENNNGGTIRFDSTVNATNFKYGYIDLGTPVVGITSFSINDCYTVDFWWNQYTVSNTGDSLGYMYSGGTLYGPADKYINTLNSSSAFDDREARSPINVIIQADGSSTTSYKLRLKAFHEKYDSGSILKQFSYAKSTPAIDFNKWTHVCGVFDLGNSLGSGKKLYVYLNGNLNGVVGISSSGEEPYSFDQNGNSHIGASSMTYQSSPYSLRGNGAIGEMGPFKIYNRALSQTEAKQNYNSLSERYNLLPAESTAVASGQEVWTSDDTWLVPEGVVTISAVCVGGGGGASIGGGGWSGAGGGGGALSYKNSISVTPKETLTITVGDGGEGDTSGEAGGTTQIKRGSTVLLQANGGAGGGYRSAGGEGGETWASADGGGDGGDGGTSTQNTTFQDGQGGGGGGAGGYSGAGGNGGYGLYSLVSGHEITPTNGSAAAASSGGAGGGGPSGGDGEGGGGVGIIEKADTGGSASRNSHGESGSSGTEGTDAGGNYGGGGGGRQSSGTANDGAGGAVRIIWGDYFTNSRSYPSNSADA